MNLTGIYLVCGGKIDKPLLAYSDPTDFNSAS